MTTCPETGEPLAPLANEAGTKSLGMIVGDKYRVGRRLGKGPSGIVYEAQRLDHGLTVALKLIRVPEKHDVDAKLARIKNDASALSAVAHPNICAPQDFGTMPDGTIYVVTERLRGAPLKIVPAGLPEEEARSILLQILSALHVAHDAGVVHENLKPTNIYLARRAACPPLVKILDFGGCAARTPRYMAPEALAGRTSDRRADLWACGVIVYRMLTGKRPYDGGEVADLIVKIEKGFPVRPTSLRSGIASHWDSVCRRALEKDRKKRFLDALEFVDAIPLPPAPDTERELLPSLASLTPSSSQAIDVIPESAIPSSPRFIPIIPSLALNTPKPPGDPLGRVIANKYRLEALLGEGNAGAVYRGVHVDLDRPVAVKILHARHQTDSQFVRRFKKEARIVSQLDHVNVTRVLDFGEEEGSLLYLVMEYVPGESLEAVLTASTKLPTMRVVNVGIQVCNALVAAHEMGIIHRDIKPENILLVAQDPDDTGPSDLVKVCDFGTAKLRMPTDQGDVTAVNMLFGSPAYMSPEQARCEELDPRSDIYSLGVTLYEALVGELPILATGLAEQLTKAQSQVPKTPSEVMPGVDPLLEDILLRMLEKDPAKRHTNARELRAELQEVATQLSPSSTPMVQTVTFSKYPSSN
jgi:serine/threonine protein kinase